MPGRELVAMAEASGYDALFITDHGKVWSPWQLSALQEWSDTVRVYPGIEISLMSGVDLLVLGATDPIYETLTTPSEIFAQACADDCLTVVAHPYRWGDTLPAYCRLADAIEVRTCNHPDPDQETRARGFAREHRLAEMYASDAHGVNFLNRFWIETNEEFFTPQEFRRIVLTGWYANRQRDVPHGLAPTYKAGSMDELADEDRLYLEEQPTV